MQFENTRAYNFEGAFRGMRNPMNSWGRSDSDFHAGLNGETEAVLGPNDIQLAQRLIRAGAEHRKFLRQILVSVDITAPLYWWKEFDTYKVGTVSNACSTMHRIMEKPFTIDDFSHEHLTYRCKELLCSIIEVLNEARDCYLSYDKYAEDMLFVEDIACRKDLWWQVIQLLPASYQQRRTVTLSYENLFSICRQRKGHKLDEWSAEDGSFLAWARELPYASLLIFDDHMPNESERGCPSGR